MHSRIGHPGKNSVQEVQGPLRTGTIQDGPEDAAKLRPRRPEYRGLSVEPLGSEEKLVGQRAVRGDGDAHRRDSDDGGEDVVPSPHFVERWKAWH